ncbi:MAG: dihydrolipoyl dehydrogenase [Limnochordaceae bacterium]|nr:dihydrolipoyl dehydrogenase [Limnochordaceae bacterium]
MQEWDLVILGAGPGGYVAAIRGAQIGMRVALVEKDRLGGLCLNRGCIPTKAMVKSAEVLLTAKKAETFGVRVEGAAVDFRRVVARRQEVVDGLVHGLEQLMRSNGVQVFPGHGAVLRDGTVEVMPAGGAGSGSEQQRVALRGRRLILATGSQAAHLPIPGADLPGVVDSDGLLALDRVPERLVIIGGGIVGVEFASIFHAFGSKVTILELLPSLLPVADQEISRRLATSFRRAGIEARTGVRVEAIEAQPGQTPFGPPKQVHFTDGQDRPGTVEADVVLVAVGRRPAYTGFDPAELGIEVTRAGIKVDETMQTTRPGVYAIGDVNGLSPLAHAASAQGLLAVEHAAGRKVRPWGTSPVPSAVFTFPEVAWAGLTEEAAQAAGIPVRIGRFLYGALGRAHVEGETEGVVKILARAEPPDEGEIVGLHIIGRGACELIHEGVLAMRFGATAEELAEAIHAHPTLSEAVGEAAHALVGLPIHMARR